MEVKIDTELAIRLYRDQGLPTTQVSKTVGCSVQTLITRLRAAGVTIRSSGDHRIKVDFETLRHEYEDLKMSTPSIANKHQMKSSSIWARLVRGDVKMRDRKEEAVKATIKIPISEHSIICERYKRNKNESCADIAADYGVHKTTIASILKKYDIDPEHSGARIKSYKGGITALHDRIRHCEQSNFWRRACMERDDYKCRITDETGELVIHHYPKSFSKLFNEFLSQHPDMNPIGNCDELFELAQDYAPFWDIDNGMTVTKEMHKRLHMHNGIKDEELITLYDKGWSCQRISKYFGKSLSFVRARFLAINKTRRSVGFYNQERNEISQETQAGVLEAYLRGEIVREICGRYDIGSSTLYKILRDNDITPGNRKKSKESKARQERDRVKQLIDAGVTINELARMYNVSDTTIRNILK